MVEERVDARIINLTSDQECQIILDDEQRDFNKIK
jgi:hypothetical protein